MAQSTLAKLRERNIREQNAVAEPDHATDPTTPLPTELPTDTPTTLHTDTPADRPTALPPNTHTDTPTHPPTDAPAYLPPDGPTVRPTRRPTHRATPATSSPHVKALLSRQVGKEPTMVTSIRLRTSTAERLEALYRETGLAKGDIIQAALDVFLGEGTDA